MAYNPQNANGQTTMANSAPVTIASNQSTLNVTTLATGSGGYSVTGSTLTNTVINVGTANTPGVVAGWYIYNSNNVVTYVQFFNAQASAVTLGTTIPSYSIGVPALSAANLMSPTGIAHTTAISIAATTTRAGSTAPGTAIDINIFYKQ